MSGASMRSAVVIAAVLFLCQSVLTAADASTAPATAPAAKPVPQDVIERIQSQFNIAETPATEQEAMKIVSRHMQQVLTEGRQVEQQYADAPNLYLVRGMMLSAALELVGVAPTQENQDQIMQVAQRIMDSPAPPEAKLQADFLLMRQMLATLPVTSAPAPEEIAKRIQAFLARYTGTPVAARSLAYGVLLSSSAGLEDLKGSLLDRLEKEYGTQPDIRSFLLLQGRGNFAAKLTRLDGKVLTVPGDISAKLIVIDFWATWCGPCVAEAPHMKKIYEQFRAKGVEFVGISLDEDPSAKEKVEKFAKDYGLTWVQTVSGKGWLDPVAHEYGVSAIPSVWVIDSTGRIITNEAYGRLEEVLAEALNKKSATTASAPAAPPPGK